MDGTVREGGREGGVDWDIGRVGEGKSMYSRGRNIPRRGR